MTIRVRDLMTRDVVSISAEAGIREIALLLHRFKVSALPVVDDHDRVVGLVSQSDLLLRLADPLTGESWHMTHGWTRHDRSKATATTAWRLMTAPVVTAAPEETVEQAATLMHRYRVNRLPVVNTSGALLGILSRSDLVGVYTRPDAWIQDAISRRLLIEFDLPEVQASVDRGVVTLTGRVRLRSSSLALRRAIRHIEGAVHVDDRIEYAADDLSPFASMLLPE
ncbi:CBS domain-containing protein [Salinactinospora qingdaonensis]|uniref:CBS domain-containing protein n=1 Tax=Salinactinospora qingdaonensis TaxID=702744 RepID=A0ABP7GER1_9ACTN